MNNIFCLTSYTERFQTGWLALIGAVLGNIAGFIWGTPALIYVFFGMLLLDFITGVCAALVKEEEVNSKGLHGTTFKLIAYLSILVVAACFGLPPLEMTWVKTAALGWIIFGEGVSVLENCEVILGRRIPFLTKLKKILDIVKNGKTVDSDIKVNHNAGKTDKDINGTG